MSKVLIVEDEEAIADIEKDYLELSGFEVTICKDGTSGLAEALDGEYDICILDVMLPGIDGFEICKKVRETKNIPIIMVSAKKEDIDKIRGLGVGADDYMTKPFSPSELVARVKAHLSRYERLINSSQPENDIIEIRGIKIDKTARRVFVNGEEKIFTTKEFDLLTFLAEHPNHVYTKEELFKEIWDMDSIGDIATVTVHIKKIREKIELEQALQQTISLITEQNKEYNRLDKEQTSVSDILDKASRRKDLLAFKEQYDIYNSQLAERYTAYKQYEEEYSKLPSVEKLSIQFSNLDELNKISIQLKHIELSSSEKERLDSLEEKLSNVTDKEIDYYMKAYNKMSSLYQDIKDTRAHLTANYEAVYDKPKKSSPAITIAVAIIGIILIAAGIIIPSLAVITFLLGIVCIMGGIAYGLVNKDRYKNNMRTYNIRNEQYDIIKEKLDTLTKQYNKLQHDIDEWISAIVPEHNIDDTYYELMQLSQQKKELSMLRDRELKYNKRLKEYNVTAIIGSINTFMSDYMEHTAIPDIQGFDNAINECISKLNSIRQRINYIEQYRKSYMDADNAFKRFRQNNVNYEQQLSMLRELDDMPDYDITELNAQLNNIRSGMELCSNTINEYNSRLNSKENELDELSSYESQLNGLEADYETLLANYNNLLKAKDYLEKARISYAKKYQAPVNAKFKEYFDIVSDNTDSNMYSFDIHNNLLKNEAGQYREIRFLSSGCKDLAGICMRFAFIDSMYKDKKPFIILDDPFVNMDTFSINNAHRLIEKLAKKYQILYFTCHNSRTMK